MGVLQKTVLTFHAGLLMHRFLEVSPGRMPIESATNKVEGVIGVFSVWFFHCPPWKFFYRHPYSHRLNMLGLVAAFTHAGLTIRHRKKSL